MRTLRTLILSDLHLGSRSCNVELIEEVVNHETFDRLILNGDTINNVNFKKLNSRHWALLEKFREVGRSRELVLIRGNHDHEWDYLDCQANGKEHNGMLTTGHLLPAVLGVPMIEEYRLDVNGRPYVVLHGDRFDPILNYRLLTETAFFTYQVTAKVNKKLAKWLKKKSKRWTGAVDTVRARSVAFARDAGTTGIVTGHTHFAEDVRVEGIHFVNSGSWTEVPCGYVTADADGLTLHHVND